MAKRTIVGSVTDAAVDLKDSILGILSPPAVVRAEESARKSIMKAGRGAIKSAKRAVSSKKKAVKKTARKAISKTKSAVKKAAKKVAGRKKHF